MAGSGPAMTSSAAGRGAAPPPVRPAQPVATLAASMRGASDGASQPWRAAVIGESRRRVEDARFLTSQGRYVADLVPPDALHGVVLRSPHAHARILSIDAAAARG